VANLIEIKKERNKVDIVPASRLSYKLESFPLKRSILHVVCWVQHVSHQNKTKFLTLGHNISVSIEKIVIGVFDASIEAEKNTVLIEGKPKGRVINVDTNVIFKKINNDELIAMWIWKSVWLLKYDFYLCM